MKLYMFALTLNSLYCLILIACILYEHRFNKAFIPPIYINYLTYEIWVMRYYVYLNSLYDPEGFISNRNNLKPKIYINRIVWHERNKMYWPLNSTSVVKEFIIL